MKTALTTAGHRVVAYVEIDANGRHTITDQHHRILGYFDPRTNRTTDRNHRPVGYGYQLPRLIPGSVAEESRGTIKPKPPLTPAKARAEANRKTKVQAQINQTSADYTNKIADLRGKLARRS